MNHCRDCNSDYATPGSCNCFAVGGKRHAAPSPSIGYWPPYPWVQPWYPWGTPAPYPYTIGTLPGSDATITWGIDVNVSGNSVRAERVTGGFVFSNGVE